MCGIIGYIGGREVARVLIEGLKRLEYRGYDSAGLALCDGKSIFIKRVKGKIKDLENLFFKSPINGIYGIGHTRWATHGRPSEENAHPHRDCSGEIVVVHNGIIENYLTLKEELKKEGHKFKSETDSEIIAHLIEKYFEGNLLYAFAKALKRLEGVFAVLAISKSDPFKIVGGRFGPPLILGLGKGEFILSSDLTAILPYTKEVTIMEDGELLEVAPNKVSFTDFSGNPITKERRYINWDPIMVEKGGFKHFMLKEIHEQPRALRETIIGRVSLENLMVYLDDINLSEEYLKQIERVMIIACGTSWHAGLIGKYFMENIARVPCEVDYASEFRYRDFIWNEKTLGICISQSGETADTIAGMREIRRRLGKVITICNVDGSTAIREADGAILTHAGPEIGVASTKAFTAQLMALVLFSIYLAQIKKIIAKDEAYELLIELQKIPQKVEIVLENENKIENLSTKFLSVSDFFYLGRWVNYPIALEGALKLKEIAYIHAEGYPAGEMKHGPIALIDEKMPVFAIAPKDRIESKVLSNISEVKARNGIVLALTTEGNIEIEGKADEIIYVPKTHELFTPFLTVVPLQLFAYYMALKKGHDVDQPRNLAKSVTVE
ncbi:MAG: glutamine--fructose-6-phosphate transaminase (isomerizing) [Candidatus Aminicenantia bacterium]